MDEITIRNGVVYFYKVLSKNDDGTCTCQTVLTLKLEDIKKIIKALDETEPLIKDEIVINRNLCDSCINDGCIFQHGIVRNHCDFYKAESKDKSMDLTE